MLLKREFPKKSTPPELREKITALDLKLIELNPHIPLASDIVKAFPKTNISSLQSATKELSAKGHYTPSDIERDRVLLNCSPNEVLCIYAKRVVKAGRMAEAEKSTLQPIQIKVVQRNIEKIKQKIQGYERVLSGETFDSKIDFELFHLSIHTTRTEITKYKTELEKDLAEQTTL